jgi:hypothetical protein
VQCGNLSRIALQVSKLDFTMFAIRMDKHYGADVATLQSGSDDVFEQRNQTQVGQSGVVWSHLREEAGTANIGFEEKILRLRAYGLRSV